MSADHEQPFESQGTEAIPLRVVPIASGMAFLISNVANSQRYPLVEKVAQKLIAKYQTSSCQDLRNQKSAPPPSGQQAAMMQKAMAELRENPAMRQAFINKVAPPIANKIFECGMIPWTTLVTTRPSLMYEKHLSAQTRRSVKDYYECCSDH